MDSRRWTGYRPRAGDVIVCTYPKCGTTWMQQIVSLLIFQSPEPRAVTAGAPWIDARFIGPVEGPLDLIEAQTHRRSLKSHLPFDALPFHSEVRYIHVARDGLDALMSWHNHSVKYRRQELLDQVGLADETIARAYPRPAVSPHDFFQAWMGLDREQETDISAASFFETERTWWEARERPNVLMVHYNSLKRDLDGGMRRIADFLEIETPEKLWPELVQAATFEVMKRDGAALMPGAVTGWADGHKDFLFKGRNERWREELTQADFALYRERAARELSPELARWLEMGAFDASSP